MKYPTNVTVHVYEAGNPDLHMWVSIDTDGVEVEKGDGSWMAEEDLNRVEDELGRKIIGDARDDLLEILENYYEVVKAV